MNELIKVTYDNEQRPTVLGRDLHDALEIETPYHKWFPRMCEYGFVEGSDFWTFLSESTGGRPGMDHQMTIEMAKEICMIQRTEIGKKYREYFLELERQWNSPEAVFSRALQMANKKLEELKKINVQLVETNAVQSQQIAELSPKASYYDIVLQCPDLVSIGKIAKDYGKSAVWLNKWLSDHKIQYKQGGIWLLYQKYADKGYTQTKTYAGPDGNGEMHSHVNTYWTQKGRLFLYEQLKAEGILPTIERDAA